MRREVVTERPLPGFDQAAIDGYAVRSVDVLGVNDNEADESRKRRQPAGDGKYRGRCAHAEPEAGAERAARVAPMPMLADAVLPLRWTDGGEARVRVLRGVGRGPTSVEPATTSSRVTSRCGPARSSARRRWAAGGGGARTRAGAPAARLSVMSVGGELVDISRTPGNGQVYDVEFYALAAAGRDAGAEVDRVGIVDTDPKELRKPSKARSTAPKSW